MIQLKEVAPKAHDLFLAMFKDTIAPLGREAAIFTLDVCMQKKLWLFTDKLKDFVGP